MILTPPSLAAMTQLPAIKASGVAHLPNTTQWTARTERGDYLIQVAWPLAWDEHRSPSNQDEVVNIV